MSTVWHAARELIVLCLALVAAAVPTTSAELCGGACILRAVWKGRGFVRVTPATSLHASAAALENYEGYGLTRTHALTPARARSRHV